MNHSASIACGTPLESRWVPLRVMVLTAMLAVAVPSTGDATEIEFHGLLDLAANQQTAAYELNRLTRGDNPFDPVSTRLFAESKVNDHVDVLGQLVVRDAVGVFLDGAYLMYTPLPERDLHVLAGKLPWQVGTWGPRTYSNKNPLIGTPLIYAYHTTLHWAAIPATPEQLLGTAGEGESHVDYIGIPMGPGMPIVDDSYWDVGVSLTGSQRPFEYALGVNAGAPGWPSVDEEDNSGKTVLGRIGIAPLPGLRLGVSGAFGPYLVYVLNPVLPAGRNVNDYAQTLAMGDFEWLADHLEVRAEAARNLWETPTLGTVSVTGGYLEAKYSLPWGTYVAGRYDRLRFGDITTTAGERRSWDDNVRRIETSAGYRFSRDVLGKLDYQLIEMEHQVDHTHPRLPLFSAQLSVAF